MTLKKFLTEMAPEATRLAEKDTVARVEIHFEDGPVMMFSAQDDHVYYVPDFLHRKVKQGKVVFNKKAKIA